MEEINFILEDSKQAMEKSIIHLNLELGKIRAGRANPSMLDSVKVDYYGSLTPLSQIANISTLDSRTLTIQPWEKAMLEDITKTIMNANLGLNPQNNGEVILISVPVLTEERRIDLVKRSKAEGEQAKISIRSQRKDANEMVRNLKEEGLSEDEIKTSEEEIQKLTDLFTRKVDELVDLKEADIMKV
jgi:ribosome recycling factor